MSIQRSEHDPFVDKGRRDLFEKGRGVALPESAYHFVPGGQCFPMPVQRSEHDPFPEEGRRDRFEQGRILACTESAYHLVEDGQCFLHSVQIPRTERCTDPLCRGYQPGEFRHVLGRLAGPKVIRSRAVRRLLRRVREDRAPSEHAREIFGNRCKQLFAIPGQCRQFDQTRERPKVQ